MRSVRIATVVFCQLIWPCYVLAADETIPQSVLDSQKAAAAFEKSANLAGALAEYNNIIQSFPQTPYGLDACANVSRLCIASKQYSQLPQVAGTICTNFADQRGSLDILSDMVTKCMYAGSHADGISICAEARKAFSSQPKGILVNGWLGMICANQRKTAEAEQIKQLVLNSADRVTSDFLKAMGNIGWGYYCSGLYNEALVTYRQALEPHKTHPGAVHLQYNIVKTCLAKKDIETAQSEMDILLTTYATRGNTFGLACKLAKEYRQNGFSDQAILVYKKLQSQFADHEQVSIAWDALVETYADRRELENALETLRTDIARYPGRRELLRMITRIAVEEARAGKTDIAWGLVDDIFSQSPAGADQLYGYTTRARVYVHQGNDAQATEVLNDALEQFAAYPDALAYHLFGVGEEYYMNAMLSANRGNQSEANAAFNRAIIAWERVIAGHQITNKRYADYYYHIGLAYWHTKEYDNALSYYEQLKSCWPDYKNIDEVLIKLAECHWQMYKASQQTAAVTAYGLESAVQQLVANKSDAPYEELVWNLANLLFQNQQWPEAIKYFGLFFEFRSTDPDRLTEAHYYLAQSYEQNRDYQNAIQHYLDYLGSMKGTNRERVIDIQKRINQLRIKLDSAS